MNKECLFCDEELKQIGKNKKYCSDKCKNKIYMSSGHYVYHAIIQRCNNKNHKHYKYYGGKGIKCTISKNKFMDIYWRTSECELCGVKLQNKDKSSKNGRTVDRINVNDNYHESNIRIICKSCNSSIINGLSKDDIQYIRKCFKKGSHKFGSRALGRKFGVNKNTIISIVNNNVRRVL
jgi:hypothetical protein